MHLYGKEVQEDDELDVLPPEPVGVETEARFSDRNFWCVCGGALLMVPLQGKRVDLGGERLAAESE